MKRIISLAVAGALLLGTVCTAGAFEVKPKSQWDFSFGWVENTNYTAKGSPFLDSGNGGPGRDNFEARQRVRVGADLIVSEQLSGTVYFEIGDMLWGNGGPGAPAFGGVPGGAQGGDGINVETKHAYLDWMIPGTQAKVRMGLQTLGLPHFTSANPVFNHDVTAAVISAPITDQFGITAFWARPFDVNGSNDGVGNNFNDEIDMFGIILPVTLEGMKISPYAVYASIGGQPVAGNMAGVAVNGNPNTSTNGWVAGLAYQLTMFDPLTFAFNFVYSQVNGEGRNNVDIPEISGWFFDAALTYKLDFGTAGLFGWYSTGDDFDDARGGEFGRPAMFGNDTGFGYTSFGQFGRMNRPGITMDNAISNTSAGTWGIGIEMANMSFIEDLSHTIRLAYYRGTNDADMVRNGFVGANNRTFTLLQSNERIYMTEDDSAWEVNFDHKYNIYENLTAYLELGYISMDLDGDVWGNRVAGRTARTDDAWKAMLSFQFRF